MTATAWILPASFLALLVLRVPIAFAIGGATLLTLLASMPFTPAVQTIAQRLASGIDSFALLAIPFFILSGLLMSRGGIARRLIEASKVLVGTLPGGLAFVNVLSCMLFGSIAGSAVAATSAVGGFMAPAMEKLGYRREFTTALTVSASVTGLLIPPSNILIVYAVASGGLSIAALFVAGYLPGILLGLALMAVCALWAKRWNLPAGERIPLREALVKLADAVPSLMIIVLVMGGILGGIVTPTEAGVLAVLYALFLAVGVYREIRWRELPDILARSVETTAVVMLLIGTSMAMSWVLAYENVPQTISEALLGISDNRYVLLLIINVALLVVGAFIDMTPAVLIFTPIFLPVAVELGMTPLHFGIMLVTNLCIGLCTPPVGSVLFVGCAVTEVPLARALRPLIPMYAAMFIVLLLVTYVPGISTWLPALFGLI